MLKKILFFIFLVFVFLVFFGINISHLDPDFGWHLKMGELILQHGIPKTDPFSYTMPSYPYVDHEWLLSVLMYIINQSAGYTWLAILFAIAMTITPFMVLRNKTWSLGLVSAILIFTVFISRAGVRPQIVSWLFFGILLEALWNENTWRKIRWFIPLLFIVWVNMHGSFVLGIGMLVIFVLCQIVQTKRIDRTNVIVLFISCVATLLNPYGWRIWWEVFMSMTDPLLHRYILEWLPFYSITDLGLIVTVGFIVGLIRCFPTQRPVLWKIVLIVLLFIAALNAVRHTPFFVIAGGLLITDYFSLFYQQANKSIWGRKYIHRVYGLFVFVAGAAFFTGTVIYGKGLTVLTPGTFYPTKAIAYLRQHPVRGQIFNNYTWGGYLIWQLPEKKVFIDGRMPSFRTKEVAGESAWVFKDYIQIMQGKNVRTLFDKFNVKLVLVPNSLVEKRLDWLTQLSTTLGFMLPMRQDNTLINLLRKERWTISYQDEASLLLKGPSQYR